MNKLNDLTPNEEANKADRKSSVRFNQEISMSLH